MEDVGDLRQFVIRWNNRFQIDRWWRSKHEIAFNSSQHREMNFIDMKFEYIEDMLIRRYTEKKKKDNENPLDHYEPGHGSYLRKRVIRYSQQQIDNAFDNLSLG